mmetsp:Transcript_4452/g.15632  ORF Transcript_4452/g.15632 Transcript_4452/m.15632 type:complete len:443 (+) Transcript_4452:2009-3337(+)
MSDAENARESSGPSVPHLDDHLLRAGSPHEVAGDEHCCHLGAVHGEDTFAEVVVSLLALARLPHVHKSVVACCPQCVAHLSLSPLSHSLSPSPLRRPHHCHARHWRPVTRRKVEGKRRLAHDVRRAQVHREVPRLVARIRLRHGRLHREGAQRDAAELLLLDDSGGEALDDFVEGGPHVGVGCPAVLDDAQQVGVGVAGQLRPLARGDVVLHLGEEAELREEGLEREHFVEDHSVGVDVRLLRVLLTLDDLWRQPHRVIHLAPLQHRHPLGGKAEVGDDGDDGVGGVGAHEENVGALEVAVDEGRDPVVEEAHASGDVEGDLQLEHPVAGIGDGLLVVRVEEVVEVSARRAVRHNAEWLHAEATEADDVLVLDARHDPSLLQEVVERLRRHRVRAVLGVDVELLDGHDTAVVVGLVDGCESAPAELVEHLEFAVFDLRHLRH